MKSEKKLNKQIMKLNARFSLAQIENNDSISGKKIIFIPQCDEMITVVTEIFDNVVDLVGDLEPDENKLIQASNYLKTARLLIDSMVIDIERILEGIENKIEQKIRLN